MNGAAAKASAGDLHTALGLDMADYWTATAEGYFSRVSKPQIIAAMSEANVLLPEASAMTKTALAALAEKRMAGTRWLPKLLRQPVAETNQPDATEAA